LIDATYVAAGLPIRQPSNVDPAPSTPDLHLDPDAPANHPNPAVHLDPDAPTNQPNPAVHLDPDAPAPPKGD
jgi:hypothetical protein